MMNRIEHLMTTEEAIATLTGRAHVATPEGRTVIAHAVAHLMSR